MILGIQFPQKKELKVYSSVFLLYGFIVNMNFPYIRGNNFINSISSQR